MDNATMEVLVVVAFPELKTLPSEKAWEEGIIDAVSSAVYADKTLDTKAVRELEYEDYILVMLFVKYISDVWQDHYAKLVEEYGDPKSKTAEERIQRRLKRERFVLPAHCTFTTLYEQRSRTGGRQR